MFALLSNDDGIYAPGLAALEDIVKDEFQTLVVAPSTEQSGVGHGITFLSPLTAKEVFEVRSVGDGQLMVVLQTP